MELDKRKVGRIKIKMEKEYTWERSIWEKRGRNIGKKGIEWKKEIRIGSDFT